MATSEIFLRSWAGLSKWIFKKLGTHKKSSSQDKERNFTIYQLIKIHNEIFNKDQQTNIIEFGVDRGGSLSTFSKFIKPNTNIFGLDSFGEYSNEIKQNVTNFDPHYQGSYKPFTKKLDLSPLIIKI